MTTPAPRHRGARRLSLLATAALALVTACESQLPTAAEVERMDVAALEARTAVGMPGTAGGPVRFFMNGREITEAEAKALPAGKIATFVIAKGSDQVREVRISTAGDTMRVVRGVRVEARQLDSGAAGGATLVGVRIDSAGSAGMTVRGDTAVVRIVRRDGAPSAAAGQAVTVEMRRRAGADTSTVVVGNASATLTGTAQPLLLVDGVRMSQEALKRLAPDAIASIEVIKGPAASRQYGPDGANGVIVVTTKGKK